MMTKLETALESKACFVIHLSGNDWQFVAEAPVHVIKIKHCASEESCWQKSCDQ